MGDELDSAHDGRPQPDHRVAHRVLVPRTHELARLHPPFPHAHHVIDGLIEERQEERHSGRDDDGVHEKRLPDLLRDWGARQQRQFGWTDVVSLPASPEPGFALAAKTAKNTT